YRNGRVLHSVFAAAVQFWPLASIQNSLLWVDTGQTRMIGIDPGCVKTLGVIRAVRKRPEFHAPVRNLVS
ncbi:hypothetical protein, partial [Pseudomonas aeruginosa]